MIITEYRAKNFRNISEICLYPDSRTNILVGENGQGKTNIIESIWLFTGCNSFRTYKYGEMIKVGEKEAGTKLFFESQGLANDAAIRMDGTKRTYTLNGIPRENSRRFLGVFRAVVFSPHSLSVIQDAPSERRKFLDIAVSMVKPAYASHLIRYSKILANRNALLRQISQGMAGEETLTAWDEELSRAGSKVTLYRQNYIKRLAPVAKEIYGEISGGREQMAIEHMHCGKGAEADEYELVENMFMALQKNRDSDIRRLFTSVGPHKEDISIKLDGMPSRNYASQGQQRSCALSLKLAEAYLIREDSGEYPVVLLDDVMSELDSQRQEFLLDYLRDWQVFITCCDARHFSKLKSFKTFCVENGKVSEV
ncbi:MAG: DNA replication/repair protein RecF [Clostridiales bacterium]|jgi:DNA replication and repair protein RecF|nr:DNA replication/repair protein RecF [Clostridiales bacterium]